MYVHFVNVVIEFLPAELKVRLQNIHEQDEHVQSEHESAHVYCIQCMYNVMLVS